MKKFLLLFAIFCGVVTNSSALTFVVGGINYNVVSAVSPFTVEVIAKTPIYTGAVTIPAQVINGATTYSVVRIGQQAFQNCVGLVSVAMPNSVTDISASAFAGCTALTNVVLSTSLKNIKGFAFTGCTSLVQINLPTSLQFIDSYTFRGCSSLITVDIPASVTSIGVATFANCSVLNSITVNSNNTVYKSVNGAILSKDGATLVQCPSGLKSFEVPESVYTIGNSSFRECLNMDTVFISSNVASIGAQAFLNCSALKAIYCSTENPPIVDATSFQGVPTTVAVNVLFSYFYSHLNVIYWDIFKDVVAFPNTFVLDGIKYSVISDNTLAVVANTTKYAGDIVFPSKIELRYQKYTVTEIGKYAFSSCTLLTSITLPNTVTTIGESAFFGCDLLTSITIPNSVSDLGTAAFSKCIGLKDVVLPSGIQTIGAEAFEKCTSLQQILLPSSVRTLMPGAFSECNSLTSVAIPENVMYVNDGAFASCSNLIAFVVAPSNGNYKADNGVLLTKNGTRLVQCPAGLTSCTIPSSVIAISPEAFSGCQKITSIVLPSTINAIERGAFFNCTELTSVVLSPSITNIAWSTFGYCKKLENITIPEGVTTIGYSAFFGCSMLKTISIPSSVTSIAGGAFETDSAITKIYCNAVTPPVIADKYTFENVPKTIPLYVPVGSEAAYKSAAYWKEFTNINPVKTSMTESGEVAFVVSNPISTILTINNLEPTSLVELFNAQGTLLIKEKVGTSLAEFNVESLSKGIYIVRVTKSGQAKSFRVVKI